MYQMAGGLRHTSVCLYEKIIGLLVPEFAGIRYFPLARPFLYLRIKVMLQAKK
jgi:hypothetical protein